MKQEITLDRIIAYAPLTTLEEALKTIRDGKKYVPKYDLKDKETYVGIEVEVERVKRDVGLLALNGEAYLWNNIPDNSLRNDGKEFVSIPIKGDNIPFALSVLHTSLNKEPNCKGYEFTDRTSVHVHMNARTLTTEQVCNFILTYILVEPLLYSFVGGDRDNNIFCVPITETNLATTLGRMFVYYENSKHKDMLSCSRDWFKYTGLNLAPLLNYGTIEFRHMSGTLNEKKLISWINLILSIKQYAIRKSYTDLKEIVLNINTTSEYQAILFEIFGELTTIINLPTVEKIMEDTSIFIKDVYTQEKNLITEEVEKEILTNPIQNDFLIRLKKNGLLKFVDIPEKIRNLKLQIGEYEVHLNQYEKDIIQYTLELEKVPKEKPNSIKTLKNKISSLQEGYDSYKRAIEDLNIQIKKLESGEVIPTPKLRPRSWTRFDEVMGEIRVQPIQNPAAFWAPPPAPVLREAPEEPDF